MLVCAPERSCFAVSARRIRGLDLDGVGDEQRNFARVLTPMEVADMLVLARTEVRIAPLGSATVWTILPSR